MMLLLSLTVEAFSLFGSDEKEVSRGDLTGKWLGTRDYKSTAEFFKDGTLTYPYDRKAIAANWSWIEDGKEFKIDITLPDEGRKIWKGSVDTENSLLVEGSDFLLYDETKKEVYKHMADATSKNGEGCMRSADNAIKVDADFGRAYIRKARCIYSSPNYHDTITASDEAYLRQAVLYEEALEAKLPNHRRKWILNIAARNYAIAGSTAEHAKKALKLSKSAREEDLSELHILDTRAAALAFAGRFKDAIKAQTVLLNNLTKESHWYADALYRLRLYYDGKRFRPAMRTSPNLGKIKNMEDVQVTGKYGRSYRYNRDNAPRKYELYVENSSGPDSQFFHDSIENALGFEVNRKLISTVFEDIDGDGIEDYLHATCVGNGHVTSSRRITFEKSYVLEVTNNLEIARVHHLPECDPDRLLSNSQYGDLVTFSKNFDNQSIKKYPIEYEGKDGVYLTSLLDEDHSPLYVRVY